MGFVAFKTLPDIKKNNPNKNLICERKCFSVKSNVFDLKKSGFFKHTLST